MIQIATNVAVCRFVFVLIRIIRKNSYIGIFIIRIFTPQTPKNPRTINSRKSVT
jgi:hypothetical protein